MGRRARRLEPQEQLQEHHNTGAAKQLATGAATGATGAAKQLATGAATGATRGGPRKPPPPQSFLLWSAQIYLTATLRQPYGNLTPLRWE